MENKKEMRTLPAVALRGMTILPGMIAHFDISRERSMRAVEVAMETDRKIFIVTQVDPDVENPTVQDLYSVGLYAEVKQVIRMQNSIVRVLINGIQRASIFAFTGHPDFLETKVLLEEDYLEEELPKQAEIAMVESIQETFMKYADANHRVGQERKKKVKEINDLSQLIDYIGNSLPVDFPEKQKILEAISLTARYEALLTLLFKETEVSAYKEEFQKKVKERVDKHQKEYVLREQMAQIREELGTNDGESEIDEYREKTENLQAPEEVKARLRKEIKRLESLNDNSSESAVSRGYIETLLELPWDAATEDRKDLKYAQDILEEDHYGLKDVKERVLEFLAVRNLTKKGDAPIICLVGPPGCGKTSIAHSIARAVGKEYVRISLGGVHDEAEIRGHRKTYVGAMPGRIIEGLKQAKVKNPLMLLDEIDKVSSDHRGDVSAALLEVLDSEQNVRFRDHYVEMTVDLSDVLFIATANDRNSIPRPLWDRMEIIEIPGYTANEKFHIGRNYLVGKQLEKNGLTAKQLTFNDKALREIISGYTREAGVRELERKIGAVCRKAARRIYEGDAKKISISGANLKDFLGPVKYLPEQKNKKADVGIVRGLAWTAVGGVTLEVEVNILPGKGHLLLTGKLGDVMKESAQTALSYVRSIAPKYEIQADFFECHDIHIHIPEGATPKDGPSAGVTLTCALLSAITEIPVRSDIAMTGEVTLRGRVLPIGGLKEKLLAANMAGMKTVCIPKENRRNLEEIDSEITEGLEIILTEHVSENIELAFVKNGNAEKTKRKNSKAKK